MNVLLEATKPEILSIEQPLTTSFENWGGKIDCRKYGGLCLWVIAGVNNSTGVDLRFLLDPFVQTDIGFVSADFPDLSLWTTTVPNFFKVFRYPIEGINFLTIQGKATIVGASPGKLSLFVTKSPFLMK